MNPTQHKKLRIMAKTAMMTALICLLTAVLHIPFTHGYIHLGDAMICIAAAVLPTPHAVFAAAVGCGMADVFSGYAVYALPTVCIKACMAVICSRMGGSQCFCTRRMVSAMLGGLVNILGYWLAEWCVLRGDGFAALWATLPANAIQSAASVICFAVCAAALDRLPTHAR